MKRTLFIFVVIIALVGCNGLTQKSDNANPVAQETKKTQSAIENLKVYPEASEGMERYVIMLDSIGFDAEYEYSVELIPGKMEKVDNCNKHGLMGEIIEKTIDGYGYNYYEFSSVGNIFSTQMACPDNTEINKFISSETLMIRYNSLLPVVVYMPKGFELKYKIWKAGDLKDGQKL